jgi:type IX secretion system PorP/SprF family membrane protein
MNIINPAYAGADGEDVLSVTSRNQWLSIDKAPRTLVMSFSSARKDNLGIGVSIESDKIFIEQQTFLYLDFSYKLQIDETTNLFLGLKGGGNFYKADTQSLNTYSPFSDPAQTNLNRFNPNFGAGAYLKGQKFWISLSIPRFFKVNRDKENLISAKERIHSYLGGGYSFPLSSNIDMKPSLMLRKVKGIPINAEINNFFSFKNKFEFGVSYSFKTALSLMTLINISKGIDMGYAYQTPIEKNLSGLNIKTHEIVIRIKFEDLKKELIEEEEIEIEENK